MNSGSTLYRYLLGGIGGATRRSYPTEVFLTINCGGPSTRTATSSTDPARGV